MTPIALMVRGYLVPVEAGYVRMASVAPMDLELSQKLSVTFPLEGQNDQFAWRCDCGSFRFTLHPTGAFCAECGTEAGWMR